MIPPAYLDSLRDGPAAQWSCPCGYMNVGNVCTHCGSLRTRIYAFESGIRREIEAADRQYGRNKSAAVPGRLAGFLWWLLSRLLRLPSRISRRLGSKRDSWSAVLLEEVAEAMAARWVAGRTCCLREMLACELVQVAATAHRWLRQLEESGDTPRQSWPPEFQADAEQRRGR